MEQYFFCVCQASEDKQGAREMLEKRALCASKRQRPERRKTPVLQGFISAL